MSIERGALINVTIKNLRMGERSPIRMTAETSDGELWVLPPHAEIECVEPANWPPRRGDVWRQSSGLRWFGIESGSNVYLHSDQGDVLDPQEAYEERAGLELVSREGEPDGSQS